MSILTLTGINAGLLLMASLLAGAYAAGRHDGIRAACKAAGRPDLDPFMGG